MALSNTISAITREKFMPLLVDNIFNSNVLCLKLLKNAEKLDGGVKINVPVETAQNVSANSDWLAAGGAGAVNRGAGGGGGCYANAPGAIDWGAGGGAGGSGIVIIAENTGGPKTAGGVWSTKQVFKQIVENDWV